jgi:CRP/FNR family cyclic AMP-dependent transcriptional regulator
MGFRLTRDARIELFRNVTLFSACSDAELRRIASISTVVDIEADQVMVREGERGREFFVIVEGHATVTINGEQLATVGPGSFFGEMALLDGAPRVATVTAGGPMTVLAFNAREFTTLLSAPPASVSRRMLAGLALRLRDADVRAVRENAGGVRTEPVGVGVWSSPAL